MLRNVAIAILGWISVSSAMAGEDPRLYQVPLGPPVAATAAARIEERALAVLPHIACGEEAHYFGVLQLQDQDANFQPGEGLASTLIGKIEWLRRKGDFSTRDRVAQVRNAGCVLESSFYIDLAKPDEPENRGVAILRAAGANPYAQFGPDCNGATTTVQVDNNYIVMRASVPGACLRRQVNVAIEKWRNNRQLGSDGVPCEFGIGGTTAGDWDVVVRDLLRVFFIDRGTGGNVLDAAMRVRLRDQLASVSGRPMPSESYSLFECGNSERTQGSPEDVAAEQGDAPLHEEIWDDLWPGIKWLLWRILLLIVAATVIGAVAAGLIALGAGPAAVAIAVAGVAAATLIVSFGRIPETENHLLMIESSRFLKNKILIEHYRANGMIGDEMAFEDHQTNLRSWLLDRMQGVMEEDFEEYNSRPYQRYSLVALMNLYDYSEDKLLKEASQMVLDRQLAKMIVSSSEGRRFVPFRRQMQRLAKKFDKPDGERVAALTDSDFAASLALAYIGHTQHFVEHRAHRAAAASLLYAATSSYPPPAMLIDLGLQRPGGLRPDGTDGIWQHSVRHASYERYVRGRHFTLIAGGDESGFANSFELLGIPVAALDANDRGAAFPTTLLIEAAPENPLLPGGVARDQLHEFLQIRGDRVNYSDFHTYANNLCVWKGFACGKDIRLPTAMGNCFVTGPTRNGGTWRFMDSAACTGYAPDRRVFIALVSNSAILQPEDGRLKAGDGFFEVIDAVDAANNFAAFQAGLLSANPQLGTVRGVYRSARGEALSFDIFVKKGIHSVNGATQPDLDDWPFGIHGNVVNTPAPGLVEIVNARLNKRLVLDFQSASFPSRQEF